MLESKSWAGVVGAAILAACGQGEDPGEPRTSEVEQGASTAGAGAVFVLSNEPAGENAVIALDRGADGKLAPAGRFSTGGSGTGAGLGSQGALVLSADGRWLFAVDAGSDELTLFRVRGTALEWASRVPTGGDMPVSVTTHGDLAFVVHAGTADIAGFERDGQDLRPIAASRRPLAGAAPAQVSFDPKGELLVVTEKATNSFSLYRVEDDGRVEGPFASAAAGETPFGFAFASAELIVVSEAFGGRPGESALSSYRIEGDGIVPVAPVVRDGQTAACWVAIPRHARHAYTTNTGSDNVSIYALGRDGSLGPAAPAAPTGAGSVPTDAAVSQSGRWLHVLDSGLDAVSTFRIEGDGTLVDAGDATGLPGSVVGIAAR
jgi:6-phosphogluconolactonase (cycloisomerase 2 family)